MFRLQALGGTELIGPDGESVGSLIRRPKRFSLLIYLAVARPSGLHRRDSVVATFWPESTDRRARGALSQSLHILRRTLGDAVVTRGREEVGIDDELVWCDARAFRDLVKAGAHAEALAEYRGELLPGFHLAGARGFEDWLDRERRHLHRLAREAVDAAVRREEKRGNTWGAIRLLYRAVEQHATDERLVERLIELLTLVGDRSGALEAFARFRRRLGEEYGLEISSRTTALVERVRRGPTPAMDRNEVVGRSTPSVAVVPLEMRAEGSDQPDRDYVAHSMTDALITELSRTTDLRVVSYASVASLAGRHAPRHVGRTLGVDAVVYGSVRTTHDRVRLRLQLVDARSEATLWRGVKEGRRPEIRGLQRAAARAIASGLGAETVPHRSVGRPPDRVDPGAYNEYLRGLFYIMSGQYDQVLPHLENAVRHAPDLAEAYVVIAMIHSIEVLAGASSPAQAGERMLAAARRAVTLDPHSGPAHRAMAGYHMLIDRDWEAADRAFERADAWGIQDQRAGYHVLFVTGRGRFDEGLARSRELLHFDPLGADSQFVAGWALHKARRYEEARGQLEWVLDVAPGYPWTRPFLAATCLFLGQTDEAVEHAHQVVQRVELPTCRAYAAATLGRAGRHEEARSHLSALREGAGGYVDPFNLALVHAGLGETDAALSELERLVDEGSGQSCVIPPEPFFDPLREDRRFDRILHRLGLPRLEY